MTPVAAGFLVPLPASTAAVAATARGVHEGCGVTGVCRERPRADDAAPLRRRCQASSRSVAANGNTDELDSGWAVLGDRH